MKLPVSYPVISITNAVRGGEIPRGTSGKTQQFDYYRENIMANIKKPLAAALGAAFLATSVVPMVSAEVNPFSAQQLSGGYDLAHYGKDAEGGCSGKAGEEGGCSGKKAGAEGGCSDKAHAEGGCSDKAGADGKTGAEGESSGKATKEGGCSAGKCSGSK
jgi:uncharacterized low-complexity protein